MYVERKKKGLHKLTEVVFIAICLLVWKFVKNILLDIKSILFYKHDGHCLCKDMNASKPNSLNEGPLVPWFVLMSLIKYDIFQNHMIICSC